MNPALLHSSLFTPFLSVWPEPHVLVPRLRCFWSRDPGIRTSCNRMCCRAVGTKVGCNTVADLLIAGVPLSSSCLCGLHRHFCAAEVTGRGFV